MKIDKYEKYGAGKYRIYFNNGEVFDTYDEVIIKNNLLLKKDISDVEYKKLFDDTNLVGYYNSCLKYISVRIRSVKEIRDYLKKKSVDVSDIDLIVKRLLNENLLNDDYFCECFIKDKLNFTTMGEYKIINELKKYDIDSNIINKYSYLWDRDIMIPRIEKLVDKKIASVKGKNSYQLRDKIYRYLISQGFSSSLVVEVLNSKF